MKRGRDDDLKIELYFSRAEYTKHNLGRFRLSVTGNDGALAAERLHNDFKDGEVADLDVMLAKVHAQQGQTDQALVSLTEALGLAEDRAGKGKVINEAAALDGVLDKLAARAAGDGQFQAELARHYAEGGNLPLADAAERKARAWFEEKLAKEPGNSASGRGTGSTPPG